MMPRKYDDSDLDKAEELRRRGEKWVVVEALLGDGIKQACYYRSTKGYLGTYNESAEVMAAMSAWNGLGDKQSFIDGWKLRAKKERVFK